MIRSSSSVPPAFVSAGLALLLLSLAGTASAQTVASDVGAKAPDATVSGESAQDDRAARSRTCLRSTGSRIVAARNERAEKAGKPQRCVASAGRVYTQRDLESTGHVDIADALRSLDTAFR